MIQHIKTSSKQVHLQPQGSEPQNNKGGAQYEKQALMMCQYGTKTSLKQILLSFTW